MDALCNRHGHKYQKPPCKTCLGLFSLVLYVVLFVYSPWASVWTVRALCVHYFLVCDNNFSLHFSV